MFEDMGWYRSNYSVGEFLYWLFNAGCTATEQTCVQANWPYFCDGNNAGCTWDRKVIGTCNVVSYQSLPTEFQYFTNPDLGGALLTADYCPFYDYTPGTYCNDASQNSQVFTNGQYYGPASRCLDTTSSGTVGCYQIQCASDLSSYTVFAYSTTSGGQVCTEAGQQIKFSSGGIIPSSVTLVCAPVDIMCASGGACVDTNCIQSVKGSGGINWLGITKSPLEFWLVVGGIVLAIVICVCLVVCCCCDFAKCFCRGAGKGGRPQKVRPGGHIHYIARTVRGSRPT